MRIFWVTNFGLLPLFWWTRLIWGLYSEMTKVVTRGHWEVIEFDKWAYHKQDKYKMYQKDQMKNCYKWETFQPSKEQSTFPTVQKNIYLDHDLSTNHNPVLSQLPTAKVPKTEVWLGWIPRILRFFKMTPMLLRFEFPGNLSKNCFFAGNST